MKSSFSFSRRSSGLLLHPTSLPGHHGSGDLGPAAYRFADFLADAGQTWWQMLPVNPPGCEPGNSPYSSPSAFAGSMYLISLELLHRDGLLDRSELAPEGQLNGFVVAQFEASHRFRERRLRIAFDRFESDRKRRAALDRYAREERAWLDDWSLYAAIRQSQPAASGSTAWTSWPKPLRLRQSDALQQARRDLAREVRFQQFVQYVFEQQWNALHAYCSGRGVGLIGDIPIFVGHDSADVWANRDLFLLDRDGNPKAISGYPPDAFNKLGQTWGHAQYRWSTHVKEHFAWWVARFARTLRLFDGVRIDHFLGFHRTWHIPFGATDARRGKWVLSPGRELFETLTKALPNARIIAEDLGQLTPEASKLRDDFGFPGMRIMQFGFGKGGQYHLPHTFPANCVAYTGTHDNQTIVGWLDELRTSVSMKKRRSRAVEYMKALRYLDCDGREANWSFIRAAIASHADTVIFPAQDVLGLDARARMNVPGTAEGNWRWRLRDRQLTRDHAVRLREWCDLFDRLPPSPCTQGEGRGEGTLRVSKRALARFRRARANSKPSSQPSP